MVKCKLIRQKNLSSGSRDRRISTFGIASFQTSNVILCQNIRLIVEKVMTSSVGFFLEKSANGIRQIVTLRWKPFYLLLL